MFPGKNVNVNRIKHVWQVVECKLSDRKVTTINLTGIMTRIHLTDAKKGKN